MVIWRVQFSASVVVTEFIIPSMTLCVLFIVLQMVGNKLNKFS